MRQQVFFPLRTVLALLLITGVALLAAPRAAHAQTTVPQVTGVAFKYKLRTGTDPLTYGPVQTHDGSSSATYLKVGDQIHVEVTFSVNVDVYKRPLPNTSAELLLKFDGTGGIRSFEVDPMGSPDGYVRNKRSATFTYTVQMGDNDSSGIELHVAPAGSYGNSASFFDHSSVRSNGIVRSGSVTNLNWASASQTLADGASLKRLYIDNTAPTLATEETLRITPPARAGKSLWHTVRRTGPTDGDYTLQSDENVGKEVRYYKQDDTIAFHLKFSEPVVATAGTKPKLWLSFDDWQDTGTGAEVVDPSTPPEGTFFATLGSGSGDGSSDTLTFDYTVQAGDDAFDLGVFPNEGGLRLNATGSIKDVSRYHNLDLAPSLLEQFQTYYGWTSDTSSSPPNYAADYKGTDFLIDTFRASVRITEVITDETHDAQRRRIAPVNFEDTPGDRPGSGEGIAPGSEVKETAVQAGAFTVEIRFFNYGVGDGDGVIADDPQGFEASDIVLTGANVPASEWVVSAPVLIGLDHRHPGYYDDGVSDANLNVAQNSAAFIVYQVTLTPPDGVEGEVSIQVPENATEDIAGNFSMASNRLFVPVDTRPPVVTKPPAFAPKPADEIYTVGDEVEVLVTFDEDGVTYEGDNPPYVTIYLGERTVENARHATWQRGREVDGNSTVVPFVYPIQGSDIAFSVSVDASGVAVPRGTTVTSRDGIKPIVGTAPPAVAPGTRLTRLPTETDGTVGFGDTPTGEVSPETRQEIPVNPVVFLPEESVPKAAASVVPRSPIVFNELGNGSGDANDWLELRNVTGSAVSLKDWELSVVADGEKRDTSLIVFPDASVPANGLLLITNSEPTAEGNVLAGGDNVATAEVEHEGASHKYLVHAGLALPDDGKFLLILRNAKEKLGLNEAFVDVAGGGGSGTDAFIRDETDDYDTYVWPLQVLDAPGGDTEEALGSGKVWRRAKADSVGYHKDAWAEAAFTGLGYDRQVTKSAATAGTPGYPNSAVKETASTPKGSVTISEIMFDSAGGTLPQWIELYNASKTEVLNLNRWKLEIQNVDSADLVGRPIVTLTLQEKLIQPNQTLLIVSGDARASSASVLPADRVYNLFALHQKNLRIKKPHDTFLSAEGFYLKLTDRNGILVDEVGNTDGNRRTKDTPAWPLAMSQEEGVRSSLIRRYIDGTSAAKDGTQKGTWVLAANVKKVVAGELHWGAAEDIGTPGHRRGGALPVELSSFSVTRNEEGAVVLTWTTASEVDNAGFNLRRSEKRDSGYTLLNPMLIAGAGTTGERQTYTFTDTTTKPGVEYYYQIEEVSFGGKSVTLATRMLRGPVSAANRMLTTFGAVKKREE